MSISSSLLSLSDLECLSKMHNLLYLDLRTDESKKGENKVGPAGSAIISRLPKLADLWLGNYFDNEGFN